MSRIRTIGLLLLTLLVTACQTNSPDSLREMTFMAGFRPQANLPFVGAYVAQEKGLFTDEGLSVTIQHSAGGGEHLQLLAAGEVQVTTQDAAVLLQRRADPGLPLVSIGLIGQRGQQAFVALADSGLASPADWIGHTVGFKGTPPPDLYAILAANGLSEADIELVNVGFDPRALTEGLVDVYPVFKSNEPNLIRGWGFEVVQWEAADFGVPTLGLTYVATEELIQSDPELLQSFMKAVLRGIEYAQDNPQEAVEIVLQYAGEDADADHMRFMLESELADAESANGFGWQTEAQWQALAEMLQTTDALPEDVDITAVFTTQFLP
ncbi:MAG: nitrate ABC transporter substrate-binding protein [Ardenticatenaceae bacterium]|nr:MAG: nitrate ABC transporter substrate-binding protein [Ardenticatenaceae bacterium]